MKTTRLWQLNQLGLANAAMLVGIIGLFLSFKSIDTLIETCLTAAWIITMFYFWYGYVFLGIKGMHTQTILEYLLDFTLMLMLIGLLYMSTNSTVLDWLTLYWVLFSSTIFKYIIAKSKLKGKRRKYMDQKIQMDTLAAVLIGIAVAVNIFVGLELIPILIIAFMELGHIFYVGLITKFYDKF